MVCTSWFLCKPYETKKWEDKIDGKARRGWFIGTDHCNNKEFKGLCSKQVTKFHKIQS